MLYRVFSPNVSIAASKGSHQETAYAGLPDFSGAGCVVIGKPWVKRELDVDF